MKVLAMTVGTGRSGDDIASALLFSIKRHNPDKTVFLTSEYTHSKTMPLINDALKDQENTEEHTVQNENNVEYLFDEYVQLLKQYESEDLYVDFTSGTKAMSSAAFAAAIALNAEQVSYVTGDRDKTGRVLESSEVLSIKPEKVSAERELSKAKMLFNQCDYDAASRLAGENIDKIKAESSIYNLANTIKTLGKAYSCWERFEWNKAAQAITSKLKKKFGLYEYVDTDFLKKQIELCREVYYNPYSKLRLVDLYLNVRRKMLQGRYEDALARLYRAFEYMVQIELWNNFEINTSEVTLRKLEKFDLCNATMRKMANRVNDRKDDALRLGFKDSLELLAELENDLGMIIIKKYWSENWEPGKRYEDCKSGPLQSYLNKRNQSFLAHGTTPVDKKIPSKLLEMFYEFLEQAKIENFEQKIKFMTFVKIEPFTK